jgi:hypothetical protein
MTNISIFKQQDVTTYGPRESALGKKFASAGSTSRRIQANINGTFRRVVNGEQVGSAVRGEIQVIIIGAQTKVSRIFYKEKYDPSKEATLPNCWSNDGVTPEASAPDPQATNCMSCEQDIKGSGEGGRKACRFQRRVAVLLAGDTSGDIYQFNVPAKSLFGKGTGNVHPFESYVKFLLANGESPDAVVTNISFDSNADTMELLFTPLRNVSDEEYAGVKAAQAKPETKRYTMITVAQTDGVKKQPPAVEPKPAPKAVRSAEPEDDVELDAPVEPTKRATKKQETAPVAKKVMSDIVDAWGKDD